MPVVVEVVQDQWLAQQVGVVAVVLVVLTPLMEPMAPQILVEVAVVLVMEAQQVEMVAQESS